LPDSNARALASSTTRWGSGGGLAVWPKMASKAASHELPMLGQFPFASRSSNRTMGAKEWM